MTLDRGGIVPYGAFRDSLAARRTGVAFWPWADVAQGLGARAGAERAGMALLALSRLPGLEGCETVPGLSLSVQSLEPGAATPTHAHAWWHVYLVQEGSGLVTCTEAGPPSRLARNDVLFIPGWCLHGLRNDGDERFTTLNVSNMAQQADLANFKPG